MSRKYVRFPCTRRIVRTEAEEPRLTLSLFSPPAVFFTHHHSTPFVMFCLKVNHHVIFKAEVAPVTNKQAELHMCVTENDYSSTCGKRPLRWRFWCCESLVELDLDGSHPKTARDIRSAWDKPPSLRGSRSHTSTFSWSWRGIGEERSDNHVCVCVCVCAGRVPKWSVSLIQEQKSQGEKKHFFLIPFVWATHIMSIHPCPLLHSKVSPQAMGQLHKL